MTNTTSPTTRTARGRPRDHERDTAILRASLDLLEEVGLDRLRVKDVASRAGVGLATIYRRWPTKHELLLEAVSRVGHERFEVTGTGDARADLTSWLEATATKLAGPSGELLPGLLAGMRADPRLAETCRDSMANRQRGYVRALLAQLLGPDDPELDLRTDLGPALLFYRIMVLGERVNAADIERDIVPFVLRER
jgi:AcrR family transcriptional regulator